MDGNQEMKKIIFTPTVGYMTGNLLRWRRLERNSLARELGTKNFALVEKCKMPKKYQGGDVK